MKSGMKAAVVGAGMIGLSMCVLLTGNGVQTFLYVRDRQQERVKQYQKILEGLVEDQLLTENEKRRCESYFRVVSSYEDLKEVTIAFECVTEKLEAKRQVFKNLKDHCPKLKVAASTTSAISSLELAKCSDMEKKVLVAHPFYPPHLIPCIEVVPNSYTSGESLNILTEFLETLNREVVILKKDVPGFVGNRLQYAMLREAVHIVEEGIAAPEDVDRVLMYSFAPRYTSIGIFEHFDNCGLDLTADICKYLYPELSNIQSVQTPIKECLEKGSLGVKSGQGTYNWEEKDLDEFRKRVKEPYLNYFSWNIPKDSFKA